MPKAGGNVQLMAIKAERRPQDFEDGLRHFHRLSARCRRGKRMTNSSPPRRASVSPSSKTTAQNVRQHPAAGDRRSPAESINNIFKSVEVHKQHGEHIAVAVCVSQGKCQGVFKQRPVGQIG